MTLFNECKRYFDTDNLGALTQTPEGLLWLKLKSLSRTEFLDALQAQLNLSDVKGRAAEKFGKIFSLLASDPKGSLLKVDVFIRQNAHYLSRDEENKLVSELYQVKHFDWGGDYKNALDRFLIDRYVKKYSSFNAINNKLETEIPQAVFGYVICSWYNHWSTILIENIFKKQSKVLSACNTSPACNVRRL